MRNFYVSLCVAGIATIFGSSSCNVINPEEVVPTYVHIDSFSFSGNTAATGTNSHKVTAVYVYFNNAPVGVFDLPVTFPVIATEPGTLTVVPGIDFNGLTAYQPIYPFFEGDTMHLIPLPGGTLTHTPVTRYSAGALLRFHEDFEDGAGSDNDFKYLSGDSTNIVNIAAPGEVFEGSGSGLIRLVPGKDSVTLICRSGRLIPPNKAAYIELNYRGNMPVLIGMNTELFDGSPYSEYLIGLKPREEWGKIYIGISDFVNNYQGTEYRILLRTQKPADVTDGFLYLDNVKVVSF
jgi:hypothetical protein